MTACSFYAGGMFRPARNLLYAAIGLAACLVGGAALAGERPVVVELYTSQGCSSCPPADAALADLADRDDVIALSMHVDYWDYLGWRDTFAQHQFGQRQEAYREALKERVVYTPQFVVHGGTTVRASGLGPAIRAARNAADVVHLAIEPHEGMLMCRIEPLAGPVSGTIWIAKYTRVATVEITRGENAGRTTTYHNVVTSLSRYGDWSGDAPDEYPMPQPEPGEGVAVWIQDGDAGPILAAARIENPAP